MPPAKGEGPGRALPFAATLLVLLAVRRRRHPRAIKAVAPSEGSAASCAQPEVIEKPAGSGAKESRRSRVVDAVAVGLLTGLIAVACTAILDDRRSSRETAQSERLGWRVTIATSESFQEVDFSETDLSRIQLSGRDFSRASFRSTNLRAATFRDADLVGADLREADLSNVAFANASLKEANVESATLDGADFRGADVSGVDFASAASSDNLDLRNVCFDAATVWSQPRPRLDWRSCWQGYEDDAPTPSELRERPELNLEGCGYFSDFLYFFFDDTYPSEEEACSYLAYVSAKGYSGSRKDDAFIGDEACAALGKADLNQARVLANLDRDLDATEVDTVLLAAVTYLCPEQAEVFEDARAAD